MLLKLSYSADDITRHFLPKEYPASVGEGYLGFAQGQFSASMFGTAGGVLAMQSLLLYVVGLGAGSIPLAATLVGFFEIVWVNLLELLFSVLPEVDLILIPSDGAWLLLYH